ACVPAMCSLKTCLNCAVSKTIFQVDQFLREDGITLFDLKSIIPPMVTPFDEAGAVRYDAFERNFEKYLKAGIEGYLVLGSNGESVYLEHSEKLKLIEAARKHVPSSMMLLAGTGVESTRATIEL